MIAKGNLHSDGAKLAAYLVTGKDGEIAELAETRGLDWLGHDPVKAFATAQQIARAQTASTKPFFHTQTRNPAGEDLTGEQWLLVADRQEKRLGFTGQPRIVSFHRKDGETHMHVAWFRVDLETMRAIDPGLFKNHLKELSRTLEKELDLTQVKNERAPEDRSRAPERGEFEEARRLNTDLKAIRSIILDSFQQSDSGKAFRAALADQGLELAHGDRRDCFVVVDEAGGQHALNKRLTGVTLAEVRDRLADIDRGDLPSVKEAKAIQLERAFKRAAAVTTGSAPAAGADPQKVEPEKEAAVGRKGEGNGDISNAQARYERAYQEAYDPSAHYASLAKVAAVENSMFQKEQRALEQQIAKAADPEERRRLALRKEIEGCDYMALTSERIAQQGDAIGTKNGAADAQRQREKVQFYEQRGAALRAERDLSTEERLQRLQLRSGATHAPDRSGPDLER